MQLTVKTLKGIKFVIDIDPTCTIAEVKTVIETQKSELPAANMKLIHSGKVLKDDDTIESCNIKPNAFLVVMISKAKKAPTPAPAPAATETSKESSTTSTTTETSASATASDSTTPAAATTSSTATATATPAESSTAPVTTETTTTTATETETNSTNNDPFSSEMVTNLTAMGFPEAEVRACLRASQGNPDVAVEYLMNGIPAYVQEIANASNSASTGASSSSTTTGAVASSSSSSSNEPLAALRNHPQIDQLRQLVQSNPSTLQAVLTQIGQQQPDLLQEINANQALFLQIMNEPVSSGGVNAGNTSSSSSSSSSSAPPAPAASTSSSTGGGSSSNTDGAAALLQGMNNPAQMSQMIQGMSPEQLQAMAGMMGMAPDQLTAMAQLIGQMNPDDFQQYMNMAMQQSGAGSMEDFMGGGAGGGAGGAGGQHVVRLTEEEMAAVDRLADLGFDRNEAAQAYLACDKNEALAANLLMDGGWGDMGDGGAGGGNGDNDEDMYD